jgi:hypothetical protein
MPAPPVDNWIDPDLLQGYEKDTVEASTCPLCYGVMEDPVSGCPEGHSVCQPCAIKAHEQSASCSTCRLPVDKNKLVPNRMAKTLIANLRIRCEHAPRENAGEVGPLAAKCAKLAPATKHALKTALRARGLRSTGNKAALMARLEEDRKNGCAWRGCVGELATHRGECEWAQEKCPFKGCTESPLRTVLAKHQSTCGERLVTCDCNKEMPCKFLEDHKALCQEAEIACPNEGCSAKHARWGMDGHAQSCEYAEVTCPCPWCETTHLRRKDLDAHVRDCHLERAELQLQYLWRENARLEAWSTSEARHAAGSPTSWVFNWGAPGWGRGAFMSEMHDFGGGIEGRFSLMNAVISGERASPIPHVILFNISGMKRDSPCKIHATFSILDPNDKTVFSTEIGSVNRPADTQDYDQCAIIASDRLAGMKFELFPDEKTQAVRADGSIRLRAVVRLFLD